MSSNIFSESFIRQKIERIEKIKQKEKQQIKKIPSLSIKEADYQMSKKDYERYKSILFSGKNESRKNQVLKQKMIEKYDEIISSDSESPQKQRQIKAHHDQEIQQVQPKGFYNQNYVNQVQFNDHNKENYDSKNNNHKKNYNLQQENSENLQKPLAGRIIQLKKNQNIQNSSQVILNTESSTYRENYNDSFNTDEKTNKSSRYNSINDQCYFQSQNQTLSRKYSAQKQTGFKELVGEIKDSQNFDQLRNNFQNNRSQSVQNFQGSQNGGQIIQKQNYYQIEGQILRQGGLMEKIKQQQEQIQNNSNINQNFQRKSQTMTDGQLKQYFNQQETQKVQNNGQQQNFTLHQNNLENYQKLKTKINSFRSSRFSDKIETSQILFKDLQDSENQLTEEEKNYRFQLYKEQLKQQNNQNQNEEQFQSQCNSNTSRNEQISQNTDFVDQEELEKEKEKIVQELKQLNEIQQKCSSKKKNELPFLKTSKTQFKDEFENQWKQIENMQFDRENQLKQVFQNEQNDSFDDDYWLQKLDLKVAKVQDCKQNNLQNDQSQSDTQKSNLDITQSINYLVKEMEDLMKNSNFQKTPNENTLKEKSDSKEQFLFEIQEEEDLNDNSYYK